MQLPRLSLIRISRLCVVTAGLALAILSAMLWFASVVRGPIGLFSLGQDTSISFERGTAEVRHIYEYDVAPPVPAAQWYTVAIARGWTRPWNGTSVVPAFGFSRGYVLGMGATPNSGGGATVSPARYWLLHVPLWATMLPGALAAARLTVLWGRRRRERQLRRRGFEVMPMVHAMIYRTHVPAVVIAVALLASRAGGQPAPATRPGAAPPVHVELPSGWEARTPTVKKALQYATYPDLSAYFELIAEPRSDFARSVDLPAWAKLVKETGAKNSKLANREETELKEGKLGGHATVEYEVTGELQGVKLHYRFIMVEFGGYFCKVACWTTPSHWEAAQPKFEELVGHLKS